jgi:hypothetical protein
VKHVLSILVALVLAAAARAGAETVFIKSGVNEGQGWMFQHHTGCWVATVDHVVDERVVTYVVRRGGKQYFIQPHEAKIEASLHVALLKLPDMPGDCPASSFGEQDEEATLDRVSAEGFTTMERRSGQAAAASGISYGIAAMPVQYRARSEQSDDKRTIAVVPIRPSDQIKKSDSGAPILFHGSGIGEATLPIGLVRNVAGNQAIAVRFDKVRTYLEAMAQPPQASRPPRFSIVAFTGSTPDTACGPQNIQGPQDVRDLGARCGWRARAVKRGGITITLYLGDSPQLVSEVHLRFGQSGTPQEYDVLAAPDAGPAPTWGPSHECPRRGASNEWPCGLGMRPVRTLQIMINDTSAEIREIRVMLSESARSPAARPRIPLDPFQPVTVLDHVHHDWPCSIAVRGTYRRRGIVASAGGLAGSGAGQDLPRVPFRRTRAGIAHAVADGLSNVLDVVRRKQRVESGSRVRFMSVRERIASPSSTRRASDAWVETDELP